MRILYKTKFELAVCQFTLLITSGPRDGTHINSFKHPVIKSIWWKFEGNINLWFSQLCFSMKIVRSGKKSDWLVVYHWNMEIVHSNWIKKIKVTYVYFSFYTFFLICVLVRKHHIFSSITSFLMLYSILSLVLVRKHHHNFCTQISSFEVHPN